jgi:transposase
MFAVCAGDHDTTLKEVRERSEPCIDCAVPYTTLPRVTTASPPTIKDLHEEIAALQGTITEQAGELESLRETNRVLQEKLQYFLNRTFGRSSERLHPNQMGLFDDASSFEDEATETEEIRYERRKPKKGHGRTSFPDHLPRNEIRVELDENERTCACCNKPLKEIRQEITERGEVTPARVYVNRYVRPVYACADGCDGSVVVAELPAGVIEKGKWEASAYAHVVVAKYGDHLPLHRQTGIFRRHGIDFPKSTLCDMALRTADMVAPIVKQMRRELLQSRVLLADETRIDFRVEGKSDSAGKKIKRGFIWSYSDGERVVFDFTLNRTRAGPNEFLKDWKNGALLTDEYDGYDEICRRNQIDRGFCWAHARRRFKEALDFDKIRATPALRHINRLFWIERAITARTARLLESGELSAGDVSAFRLQIRKKRSASITQALKPLLLRWKSDPSVLPESRIGKAITYLLKSEKRWGRFQRFLRNGDLPLHNNHSENALRAVVVGRKNWLVVGSPKGGAAAATLYSIVSTCKALDVDPEAYLVDVLRHAAELKDPSRRAELTPWAWKESQAASS